jgi:protein TonB
VIRAFAISAFIHFLLMAGFIFGSGYLSKPRREAVTLEMTAVIFEKREEPSPAPLAEEPKEEAREVKPPLPKPKPPKPKPVPKEVKPKAEERPALDMALPAETPSEAVEESAEGYAESEDDASYNPQGQGSPQGSPSSSTGESEVRAYLGKNFGYIQKRVARYTVYPPKAKRSGIKGKLTVAFTINMDGTVSNITVIESSGHSMLDNAGAAAVKNAAPFPTPPSTARIAIPINFDLI